jgi:hypothetical protein
MFPTFSDDADFEMSLHESYSPASTGSDSSLGCCLNAELVASALKGLGIIPKS